MGLAACKLAHTSFVTLLAGRLRARSMKSAPYAADGMAGGGTRQALRHAAVLNRMPIRAVHAGQLAGVMIPYSWILR